MPRIDTANLEYVASLADFSGITQDSRAVKPGYIFAALPGTRVDGRDFIPQALEKGATAIIARTGTALPETGKKILLIEDDNPHLRFAQICAAYYNKQPQTVVAVTGTNGKTSTAHFAAQLWKALGKKSASMGTLGLMVDGKIRTASSMTTPDPTAPRAPSAAADPALHAPFAAVEPALRARLAALEPASRALDWSPDELRAALAQVSDLGARYLADLQPYLEVEDKTTASRVREWSRSSYQTIFGRLCGRSFLLERQGPTVDGLARTHAAPSQASSTFIAGDCPGGRFL